MPNRHNTRSKKKMNDLRSLVTNSGEKFHEAVAYLVGLVPVRQSTGRYSQKPGYFFSGKLGSTSFYLYEEYNIYKTVQLFCPDFVDEGGHFWLELTPGSIKLCRTAVGRPDQPTHEQFLEEIATWVKSLEMELMFASNLQTKVSDKLVA